MSSTYTGYDGIDLSFKELEILIREEREDWGNALVRAKGVFLVTDTQTGEQYVECAFGEHGLWGRWRHYIATGHGGNVALRSIVLGTDSNYCRRALRFSLLEHRSMQTPDETIIERQVYWKRALLGPMRQHNQNHH